MRCTTRIPSVQECAQSVSDFLNATHVPSVHVMAHSYGTLVGARFAISFADKVSSLALMDPVCFAMYMPRLIRTFLYAKSPNSGNWLLDQALLMVAKELHCAATFCRCGDRQSLGAMSVACTQLHQMLKSPCWCQQACLDCSHSPGVPVIVQLQDMSLISAMQLSTPSAWAMLPAPCHTLTYLTLTVWLMLCMALLLQAVSVARLQHVAREVACSHPGSALGR